MCIFLEVLEPLKCMDFQIVLHQNELEITFSTNFLKYCCMLWKHEKNGFINSLVETSSSVQGIRMMRYGKHSSVPFMMGWLAVSACLSVSDRLASSWACCIAICGNEREAAACKHSEELIWCGRFFLKPFLKKGYRESKEAEIWFTP